MLSPGRAGSPKRACRPARALRIARPAKAVRERRRGSGSRLCTHSECEQRQMHQDERDCTWVRVENNPAKTDPPERERTQQEGEHARHRVSPN